MNNFLRLNKTENKNYKNKELKEFREEILNKKNKKLKNIQILIHLMNKIFWVMINLRNLI
jgi:predicted nucleic acid-binding Zn ribbon protein